jgi:hypothetical protein
MKRTHFLGVAILSVISPSLSASALTQQSLSTIEVGSAARGDTIKAPATQGEAKVKHAP